LHDDTHKKAAGQRRSLFTHVTRVRNSGKNKVVGFARELDELMPIRDRRDGHVFIVWAMEREGQVG